MHQVLGFILVYRILNRDLGSGRTTHCLFPSSMNYPRDVTYKGYIHVGGPSSRSPQCGLSIRQSCPSQQGSALRQEPGDTVVPTHSSFRYIPRQSCGHPRLVIQITRSNQPVCLSSIPMSHHLCLTGANSRCDMPSVLRSNPDFG